MLNPLTPFISNTTFQTKSETPIKYHKTYLHQQSLLPNDTDSISDDEDYIYSRSGEDSKAFTPDSTQLSENFSTITNPNPDIFSTNAIETHQLVHKTFNFLIHLPSNTNNFYKVFCLMFTL